MWDLKKEWQQLQEQFGWPDEWLEGELPEERRNCQEHQHCRELYKLREAYAKLKNGNSVLRASLTIRIPEKQGLSHKQVKDALSKHLHQLADSVWAMPEDMLLEWQLPISGNLEGTEGIWKVEREG